MKLKPKEKAAILGGDRTAIKRSAQPEVQAGDKAILAWSRGGKQFLERDERKRQQHAAEGREIVIEIPRKPTFWLEFMEPEEKEDGWIVRFEAHDEREPTRLLAAPPSGARESGLKTRWAERVDREGIVHKRSVPRRGEQAESFTSESERGYGGGGRGAVDDLEGVSDAYLEEDRLRRAVDLANVERQAKNREALGLGDAEHLVSTEKRKGKPGKIAEAQVRRARRRLEKAA